MTLLELKEKVEMAGGEAKIISAVESYEKDWLSTKWTDLPNYGVCISVANEAERIDSSAEIIHINKEFGKFSVIVSYYPEDTP